MLKSGYMLGVVFSLVFALSVAAQGRITLDPPAPTSRTPIEARVFVVCQEESHTVNRVGNVIKIHILPGPEICDPPIPSLVPVSIGTLPAGEYRIEVTVGDLDSIPASRTFVVREGGMREGTIHPFAVPAQPAGLLLRLESQRFAENLCGPGVTVPCPRDGGSLRQHHPGRGRSAVVPRSGACSRARAGDDVVRRRRDPHDRRWPLLPRPQRATGAFRVRARPLSRALLLARWARLGVGERGCHRQSSALVRRDRERSDAVRVHHLPVRRTRVAVLDRRIRRHGYPQGIALIVPRAEADDLRFSLRVRDTARHEEGYGTQIPVVRESDMFRNAELTLLDLPVDPRYRTKVRMYVFDAGDHEAYVTVHQIHGAIDSRFVPLRRDCTGGDCAGAPWYGELDLAAGNTGDRVNVYITLGGADTPAWAFASVTNNDTQQVTIVTPDGKGGRPGPDYEVWR